MISCGPSARHDPVLAEAFVGPASISLRQDLGPSPAIATLHFGEKVQIIGRKRIFVRLRTRAGAEGWLDESMLLSQNEIDQIAAQSAAARNYPSQGAAITDALMNVHAAPTAQSPSYLQLKPGDKFDVLQHRLVATPPSSQRKPAVPKAPKPARKPKKENKNRVPPPPAPSAPGLPLDWVDLSKAGEDAIPPKPEEEPVPVPYQDWSMIRTSSGQSGWVLTRRLFMAIPDEVAQYAEGHRITSYFALGKVQDDDHVKTIWLWTTSEAGRSYDFDGLRVFIWSLRRHRYETAFIQRRIQGYFPTLVDSAAGTFSVCVLKADGQRYRRQFRLAENLVKLVDEKPCAADSARDDKPPTAPGPSAPPRNPFDKLKGKLKSIMP